LKQTNFIEKLVEDTLATGENPEGSSGVTFQAAAAQQNNYEQQSQYSEDNQSQFSKLNESLDDRRTQDSTVYGES